MNGSIRVAMISLTYYPAVSGIATQLAAVAPLLRDKDIEVFILTRQDPGRPPFERIAGVPVYRLLAPGPRVTASPIFILKALICLKRLQPNIIHAHELFLPTTTAIIAKRLFGTPVVTTAHMSGPLLGEIGRLKRAPFGTYRFAELKRYVDVFIAVSHMIEAEMATVDIPISRRIIIPNGIDITRFVPLPPEKKHALRKDLNLPDGPTVVYSGRLASEKRVHHLLTIWPTVRKAYPEALLLIVGTGPDETTLRQSATSGIRFVGAVNDVVPYLQAANLFVLPSVSEGLPLALLEAMATELPVIATTVGGIPDVIAHGDNGWIIPPDDIPALQNAIFTLLRDPTQCANLGHRARERIIAHYSLSNVVNRLWDVYSQSIGNGIRKGSNSAINSNRK